VIGNDAKANDATAYCGRKSSLSRQQFDGVQTLLAAGTMNVSEIARHAGLQRMASPGSRPIRRRRKRC
jgi:ActR/RegA family two-component response regulator